MARGQIAKKRIQSMAGLDPRVNYNNFKHYKFRGLMSNKERLRLTDYIMKINDNIGLVVIDGIVDLASAGVNDEAESMALASKLLEWTERQSIATFQLYCTKTRTIETPKDIWGLFSFRNQKQPFHWPNQNTRHRHRILSRSIQETSNSHQWK